MHGTARGPSDGRGWGLRQRWGHSWGGLEVGPGVGEVPRIMAGDPLEA